MEKTKLPKWTEERTEALRDMVADYDVVPYSVVEEAAVELETSKRSVGGKLRKMGFTVEPATSVERVKTFTDDESAALEEFVVANSGKYTFAEIASVFAEGKFSPREVQGKILSLELYPHVKPTPKKEVVKKYNEEEEETFRTMVVGGAFVEDIAETLGRSIESVRGKALALNRSEGLTIPKQRESHAKNRVDALEALGDLSSLTVEEIAESIDKTVRGVRSMLTHRGLTCKNYDGAARSEKLAEKRREKAA